MNFSRAHFIRQIYGAIGIFIIVAFSWVIISSDPEPLKFKTEVFVDDTELRQIEDIIDLNDGLWISKAVNELNFGYTRNAVWLRVEAEAFSSDYNIIDLNFPQLDYVDLYVVDTQTKEVIDHQLSGDRRPFDSKTIQSEKIIFNLKMPERLFWVFIRIQTDGSNQATLSITGLGDYIGKADLVSNLLHFFLGFSLFTTILYGMSLFVYRDLAYLYYVIVSLSMGSVLLFHYRTVNSYTEIFSIYTQHLALVLSVMLAFYAAIKFVQINFKKWGYDKFDSWLKYAATISIFIIASCFLVDYQSSLVIVFVYLALIAPLIMYMLLLFVISEKKNKYARSGRSLAIAWAIFLVGAGVQILGEVGLIYHAGYANHGFLLGSMGIVLSMGLILSINLQLENEQKIAAEKGLAVANQRLYQADKLAVISTMSSGLIHEIKNPLNWTKASLTIALNEIDENADLKELLDDSLEGVRRIEHIVQGLNWFAQSRTLAMTPGVKLKALIDRTLNLAKSQCEGILIVNDVPEDITVCGSENHLAQVIINILSNSIKAIEQVKDQRAGKIQISAGYMAHLSENERKTVFISWVDNGIGVAEGKIAKLFDPFFTSDEKHEGLGLGMSIAKQIIDKHEGSINIVSAKNQWTRVNICLNQS